MNKRQKKKQYMIYAKKIYKLIKRQKIAISLSGAGRPDVRIGKKDVLYELNISFGDDMMPHTTIFEKGEPINETSVL